MFVGMMRPPWEKIAGRIGYVECNCGRMLTTQQMVRAHWQDGHFDHAVYRDVESTS